MCIKTIDIRPVGVNVTAVVKVNGEISYSNYTVIHLKFPYCFNKTVRCVMITFNSIAICFEMFVMIKYLKAI